MVAQYLWGCGPNPWPRSGGLRIHVAVSCGVGCRCGSDPMLLWLWCRQAAAALIWPLAWELPYAMGVALKRKRHYCSTIPLVMQLTYFPAICPCLLSPAAQGRLHLTESSGHWLFPLDKEYPCPSDKPTVASEAKFFFFVFFCLLKHMEVPRLGIRVRFPTSLSGSGIRHSCELWCRSQTQLGSHVAVAVV